MPGILLPSRKFYENTYTETVLATDPIAHWTLGERFGATAYDTTQNHFNGAITGATLGRPGIGDGLTSMFFDGALDFVNIFSPGFAAAFDGAEGSFLIWAKVFNVGVWTDGAFRRAIHLGVDGNNYVLVEKSSTNNRIQTDRKGSGNRSVQFMDGLAIVDWMAMALTWSESTGVDGEVRHYRDGVQIGATDTNIGAFAGVLQNNRTLIGAALIVPSSVWYGWLQHAAVWDRPITPATVQRLYRARWTR